MIPGEGVGHRRQGHHPRAPIGLHDFLDEAFPLMAEDLRAARVGLDITSTVAAECAELDPALYRALEEGNVVRNTENVAMMVSAPRCMGLEELRFSYVDELQQYMKLDLSTDGPLTVFIDTLHLDVRELKGAVRVLQSLPCVGSRRTFRFLRGSRIQAACTQTTCRTVDRSRLPHCR